MLAHGFTRLRCADCPFERFVPFSGKRRGFCPSCGGRRVAERAACLIDEVLPRVPVRQWVLTLPYRLRYRLAWDHALGRAVLGVYARVLLAFHARTARAHGIPDGQTGTVTVIQRLRELPPTQRPQVHAPARWCLQRASARAAHLSPRAPTRVGSTKALFAA